MINETTIRRSLERQPRQTAGYKQLVRELHAKGNERRELEQRLKEMVRRGELVEAARDRYLLPARASGPNLIVGRLNMHRDGYGFVLPENGPRKAEIAGDIFINPQATGNAMHGDRVLVELTAVRDDGRAEGRICAWWDGLIQPWWALSITGYGKLRRSHGREGAAGDRDPLGRRTAAG